MRVDRQLAEARQSAATESPGSADQTKSSLLSRLTNWSSGVRDAAGDVIRPPVQPSSVDLAAEKAIPSADLPALKAAPEAAPVARLRDKLRGWFTAKPAAEPVTIGGSDNWVSKDVSYQITSGGTAKIGRFGPAGETVRMTSKRAPDARSRSDEMDFAGGTTYARVINYDHDGRETNRGYQLLRDGKLVWQRTESAEEVEPLTGDLPGKGQPWTTQRMINHLFDSIQPGDDQPPSPKRIAAALPSTGRWSKDGTKFTVELPSSAKWTSDISGEPGILVTDSKPGWLDRLRGRTLGAAHARNHLDQAKAEHSRPNEAAGIDYRRVSATGKRAYCLSVSPDGLTSVLSLRRGQEGTEQSSHTLVETNPLATSYTFTMTKPGADGRPDQQLEFKVVEPLVHAGPVDRSYTVSSVLPPLRPGGLPRRQPLVSVSDSTVESSSKKQQQLEAIRTAMQRMTRNPNPPAMLQEDSNCPQQSKNSTTQWTAIDTSTSCRSSYRHGMAMVRNRAVLPNWYCCGQAAPRRSTQSLVSTSASRPTHASTSPFPGTIGATLPRPGPSRAALCWTMRV